MKNGKILLLMGLVFMIALSANTFTTLAQLGTTYAQNNSYSKSYSSYTFGLGCFDNGTTIAGFNNASLSYNIGGAGTYQKSICQLNITPPDDSWAGIMTGILAPQFGYGIACDIKARFEDLDSTDDQFQIDYSSSTCNRWADASCPTDGSSLGHVQNNPSVTMIWSGSFSLGLGRRLNDDTNYTFIKNSSTKSSYYLNGTDIGEEDTVTATENTNLTLSVADGGDATFSKAIFERILCWNATTGAPQQVTTDTTPPFFNASFLNDTSLTQNDGVNFTANVSDNAVLSSCTFGINQSGITIYYNKSITGTYDQCSQNFTISVGQGNVINFTVIANDTSGNLNQSSIISTIADTTIPSILNVSIQHTLMNATNTNRVQIYCSDSESFLDVINFTMRFNQTTNNMTRFLQFNEAGQFGISQVGGIGSGITLNTKTYIWNYSIFQTDETAKEGFYNITDVGCRDRAINYAKNDSLNNLVGFNFLMDTLPLINSRSPANGGSVTSTDATGNAVITESNPSFMLVYHNITGIFSLNQTINYSGNGVTENIFNLSGMTNGMTYAYAIHLNTTFGTWTNSSNFTFIVSVPSGGSSSSGGGGGGSSTTIVNILNGTPLLSFGIYELSFFVITTPSQSQKIIKFINIGNTSFTDGKINVQGSAEPYISAKVCDINLTKCKVRDIMLKSGQNAFMVVDGNFTSKIESGVAGIIRLDGNRVFDLPVVVDRPPLYSKIVKPLVGYGLPEGLAYIAGYALLVAGIMGFMFFVRSLM